MLKIKKYQYGTTNGIGLKELIPKVGSNRGTLTDQFIGKTNYDWLKKINQPSKNVGINFTNLNKVKNTQLTTPKTSDLKGLGSGVNLSGNSDKNSVGKGNVPKNTSNTSNTLGNIASIAGSASGLIDPILGAIGVEAATTSSGVGEAISGLSGSLKGYGTIGAIAGAAVDILGAGIKYGGKKLEKSQTTGLDTGGYSFKLNPQAGGKTDLFTMGRKKKIDATTKRFDTQNLLAGNAAYKEKQNNMAANNIYGDITSKTQQQISGGLKTNILSVKKGAKIPPQYLSKIAYKAKTKVKKAQEGTSTDDLQKNSLGGEMPNVIPEGALHARKNNYEGELGEQVTSKGIPVITVEEGGKITQHAEIEHSEIIFNKEVSTKIEEWFKEYKKIDDILKKKDLENECGKFITHQILENTQDNTNLIEQT